MGQDITLKIKTELDKASGDLQKLRDAGGFKGKTGAKNLNAIESLYETLSKTDISKLSGTTLTSFLNKLLDLRRYLDTAGKGLSNFSVEYQNALKKVEKATEAQTKAQDKYNDALARQAATQKKLNLGYEGTTYKNAKGRTISNPDTIAEAYRNNSLRVFNKEGTELHGAARDTRLRNTGIEDYAKVSQEVNSFKVALDETTQALKKAKTDLENTPTGSTTHPTTVETLQHSQETSEAVAGIKENMGKETEDTIKRTSEELSNFDNNVKKTSSSLGRAFKQFTIYAIAVRAVKKALREAVQTVKEIDRALTEQAMVTGLTRKQTYNLLKDYQNMASRLGTTTKEVSSTMTQFLRQGRSINESLTLTEAAVSAAKVAGISAADSINYLTTAINGFRLSASDAMKVSDKFAAVAASAATSYEEIAIALSKVAAQANLAGMSIDYTTALLTKGIETTREAPETIGTALKTVIARMRELTDYGETLEGDTDLNNVESQLAYIGIRLKDANGELRSTEDVLNDLGQQWDTLNANQQAAIAKALAGTRQQSRLIAMMQDYERVIELQEIAEQSSGATMAQMATYMEGMDAALNKVNVAWEKIVSSIANSEVIISLITGVANIMDSIGDLLENDVIMVTSLVTIGGLLLLNLTKRHEIQKANNRLILQVNKEKQQETLADKQQLLTQATYYKNLVREQLIQRGILKDKAKQALLDDDKLNDAYANQILAMSDADLKAEYTKALAYEAQLQAEIGQTKLDILNTDIQIAQNAAGIGEIWGHFTQILQPVMAVMSIINALQQAHNANIAKGILLTKKDTVEQGKNATVKATGMFAGIVNAFSEGGIPGVIAGIALATALVAALGVGIVATVAATGGFKKTKAADAINDMSKSIYDLNKKATSLDSVISKFDDLDNKIIKTNSDLEEMHTLLESAADSLSDEEKAIFNSLTTDASRRQYLELVRNNATESLRSTRAEQRQALLRRGTNFLSSTTAADIQNVDAMYALNNASMYEYLNNLQNLTNEQRTSVRQMTQAVLENLDKQAAYSLLGNEQRLSDYTRLMGENAGLIAILQSDDSTIKERVEAFENLRSTVQSFGDPEITEAFITFNKQWENFANFSESALEYIDHLGVSVNGINDFAAAIQKLGYNSEESADKIEELFSLLDNGGNLSNSIADIFGLAIDSDEYKNILDAYDKAVGTTILNMGQNIDKFTNTVDSLYSKASEWSSLSETDKTSFLSENADLFTGPQGAQLLKAFESGNYNAINATLKTNEVFLEQRDRILGDINRQLEIEYARAEKNRDYAYIRELEAYKKQLEDTNKVFLASLKQRYEQQQAQLDLYKDYLQKETDALVESLEKRKQAYQDYFDAINKEEEANDYEERARLLVENITKLGSSLNGDAVAKRADLQQQLEELEKERLKELRQQAQEAMIKSIEDEVTQINEKLEKLLNNEQALLTVMTQDAQNPSTMIAALMSAQAATGNNTELGMQSYLQQMQSTFAAIMPNVDWSNVDVERQGDSLILNIMGQSIQLNDSEQQTIYDAIQSALRQLGYN